MILTCTTFQQIWDALQDYAIENRALFFASLGDHLCPVYDVVTGDEGDDWDFVLAVTLCHGRQEQHGEWPQLTLTEFQNRVTTQCPQGQLPEGDAWVVVDGRPYPIITVALGCNGAEAPPGHHRQHIMLMVDYAPEIYAEDNDEDEGRVGVPT